jgi:hypothetical protein
MTIVDGNIVWRQGDVPETASSAQAQALRSQPAAR